MILGILSDIHSNVFALKHILEKESHVEKWISLGDAIGIFPAVNETVEFLREKEVLCLKGDHEQIFFSGEKMEHSFTGNQAIEIQRINISEQNCRFLKELPDADSISIGNKSFFFTHNINSSQPIENKYFFDFKSLSSLYKKYDFICFGHTHHSLVYHSENSIFVNPGSAGFPLNVQGKSSYALIDVDNAEVQLKFCAFPAKEMLANIAKNNYNAKLSEYILNNCHWKN